MDWKAYLAGFALAATPTTAQANTFTVKAGTFISATIPGSTAKEASAALAAGCMDRQWGVIQSSESTVECGGNSPNSLTPLLRNGQELVSFSLLETPAGVRVQGASTLIARNGFGAESRSIGALMDQVAIMIEEAGGQFTDATRYEGLDFGFRGFDQLGFVVSSVKPGSPADRAGVKPKDLILSVNGKRLDRTSQLPRRLSKVAPGTPVQFEIQRRLERLTVTIDSPPPL